VKFCVSFRRHAAFISVKSEKKWGKDTNRRNLNGFLGMNTAARIPCYAAFANVFVIVDTLSFQMNLSVSFVHLCL
jgi:hypothetical protein